MESTRPQQSGARLTAPDAFDSGILEGSEIRTPCGPRKIERVRKGDLIVTRHFGLQPVKMIWKRELTRAYMQANRGTAPIRLNARAIGPMMPQHPIALAPHHRILIPGWRLRDMADNECGLVSAKALAGTSEAAFVDQSMDVARLYTLVFEQHRIFHVNGVPVESVCVTPKALSKLDPDLRDDVLRQFPELRDKKKSYPPRAFPTVPDRRFLPEAG